VTAVSALQHLERLAQHPGLEYATASTLNFLSGQIRTNDPGVLSDPHMDEEETSTSSRPQLFATLPPSIPVSSPPAATDVRLAPASPLQSAGIVDFESM